MSTDGIKYIAGRTQYLRGLHPSVGWLKTSCCGISWDILGIFQGEDRLKERGLEWEWGGGRASKMDMLRTRPSQKGDDLCMASRDWPHSQLLSPVLCYIVVVIAATIF